MQTLRVADVMPALVRAFEPEGNDLLLDLGRCGLRMPFANWAKVLETLDAVGLEPALALV